MVQSWLDSSGVALLFIPPRIRLRNLLSQGGAKTCKIWFGRLVHRDVSQLILHRLAFS